MKKTMMSGIFGVCLCAAVGAGQLSANAQQTPPASGSQSQPAGAARDADSQRPDSDGAKVTLQGCLERAPGASATAGATGTSGSTASTAGSFILSKAERKGPAAAKTLPSSSGASATATGQPGAAGSTGAIGTTGANAAGGASASAGAVAMSFRLQADASKLSPHVGQKVEISGTIEDAADARAAGTTDAQSSGNQSPGGKAGGTPQTLRVEEVKMVSASCTD